MSETATIESQEKKTKPKRTTNDYHKYLAGRSYQLFKRGIKSVTILDVYRLALYHFCIYAEMSTEELVAKFCPYIKDSEGMHVPNINDQIQLQRLVENFILDLHERGEQQPLCITAGFFAKNAILRCCIATNQT